MLSTWICHDNQAGRDRSTSGPGARADLLWGVQHEDAAKVLSFSDSTIERDWLAAKGCQRRELTRQAAHDDTGAVGQS